MTFTHSCKQFIKDVKKPHQSRFMSCCHFIFQLLMKVQSSLQPPQALTEKRKN